MIPIPKLKTGLPVLVSTETRVNANNTKPVDGGALQFPARYAVLLDEIRFRTYSNTDDPGLLDSTPQIRAMLKVGQHGITIQPTPLWSFGRLWNYYPNERATITTVDGNRRFSSVSWRLPAPLYLHPGSVVTALLSNVIPAGLGISDFDVNVNIAYAGRMVLPGQQIPSQWPIPSVAFWEAPNANYASSRSTDLFNPFLKTLHVQGITARLWNPDPGSSANGDYLETLEQTPAYNATDYVQIRMKDRMDMPVTKDYMPLQQFVDPNTRMWNMRTQLESNDYYVAEVRRANLDNYRTHLAMIGQRMESI